MSRPAPERPGPADAAPAPARVLGFIDVTALVVGCIVGADIYIATALGADLLGPASLLVWAAAGALAAVFALNFAQCAMAVPEAGGTYAYARRAFGPFVGFVAGWALWLAEWTSLAVFPVAFVRYLTVIFPHLTPLEGALVKVALVGALTLVNYRGTRLSGTFNDVITAIKLIPLGLLALLGAAYIIAEPAQAARNLLPFAPKGWEGASAALVQIFWAYAGFELAIIPAGEVRDARRTVPRAVLVGMGIVTAFYLTTNLVMMAAVPPARLARSSAPTSEAFEAIVSALFPPLAGAGLALMTLGALLSISGSDESGTLSLSRLGYAIARDGYLPPAMARLHPRYGTPYVSLLVQNGTVLAAALTGSLRGLIAEAVFFLTVTYALTALAALRLRREMQDTLRLPGARWSPYAALAGAILLNAGQTPPRLLAGLLLLGLAVPLYALFGRRSAPARDSGALRRDEMERRQRVFLARLLPAGRRPRA